MKVFLSFCLFLFLFHCMTNKDACAIRLGLFGISFQFLVTNQITINKKMFKNYSYQPCVRFAQSRLFNKEKKWEMKRMAVTAGSLIHPSLCGLGAPWHQPRPVRMLRAQPKEEEEEEKKEEEEEGSRRRRRGIYLCFTIEPHWGVVHNQPVSTRAKHSVVGEMNRVVDCIQCSNSSSNQKRIAKQTVMD